MSANWGDSEEPQRRHARIARAGRPWYRRVDWFSLSMIIIAVLCIFAFALFMSWHAAL